MVSRVFLYLFLFACSLLAYFPGELPADVKVSADVDQTDLFENSPVPITVTVEHSPDEKVDISSFKLGKNPIAVESVREVKITGKGALLLSVYSYSLQGIKKGLHVLPILSVDVGGKTYRSIASSYEVKAPGTIAPAKTEGGRTSGQPAVAQGAGLLRLENIVEGPTTLFPGQRMTIGYRYLYNRDIETTKEITPFLEAKGLTKIGDRVITNKTIDDVSVMEVRQQVQGDVPGEYTFGPAILEGYEYTTDTLGRREYAKQPLTTQAPVVKITVKGFPPEDKPASFNGAVGKFTFKVSLPGSSTLILGDEMTMAVDITGNDPLENVLLPELCCQPGMSGVFQLNDLPPVGTIDGKTKRFIVKLKPLSSTVKEIPSLEFSFFNPETGHYEVDRSTPIPINVKVLAPPEGIKQNPAPSSPSAGEWRKALTTPAPIEVESIYPLTPDDLKNLTCGTWWMLFLIPLGIACLIFQSRLRTYLQQKKSVVKEKTSDDVFADAMKYAPSTPEFYHSIRQSLLMKLKEKGEIEEVPLSTDKLSDRGLTGEVREFLLKLEEQRYAGQEMDEAVWQENARRLFERLKKGTVS